MEPVENLVLKEYLYVAVKEMVDSGELRVGEKIIKPDLAKRFNVSPTPINDVLNRLVGEGYIAQEARKGFFVKEVTKEEMCQAFEMRAGIEMIAIRLCCEIATDKEIAELAATFNEFHLPFDDATYKKYVEADLDFHKKIIAYSRNELLSQTLQYTGFLVRSNRKGLVRPPEDTLPEHCAIAKSLLERDSEKASTLMMWHLLSSRDLIKRSIKAEQEA